MNNKIIAVIGALLFAAAVVVGNFVQVEAAVVIEIALASFALCTCCNRRRSVLYRRYAAGNI